METIVNKIETKINALLDSETLDGITLNEQGKSAAIKNYMEAMSCAKMLANLDRAMTPPIGSFGN